MKKINLFLFIILFSPLGLAASLPVTDGGPLIEKLKPLPEHESKAIFDLGKKSCRSECVTPFGSELGIADGAIAYSNCKSTCIKPAYSFLNLKTKEITIHLQDPKNTQLHYIGVIHQCVEYARKWWMLNYGITFGSVDSAFEIIYLAEGKNIYSNEQFSLTRSINGTAKRPPARGDLIVYGADRGNPNWRHGHVAVVVAVDLNKGVVSIAEENYNNQPWLNPQAFSRQLRLFREGEYYTLLDISPDSIQNTTGAKISGWIYPSEKFPTQVLDKTE